MTEMSHGPEPADIEGDAQLLDLFSRHGDIADRVMFQKTQLDLVRVRRGKLISLNHLGVHLGSATTLGEGHKLPVGILLSEARLVNPALATTKQK